LIYNCSVALIELGHGLSSRKLSLLSPQGLRIEIGGNFTK